MLPQGDWVYLAVNIDGKTSRLRKIKALDLRIGDRVCLGPPDLEAIVQAVDCFNNTVAVSWNTEICQQSIQSRFYSIATLFIYEENRQNSEKKD